MTTRRSLFGVLAGFAAGFGFGLPAKARSVVGVFHGSTFIPLETKEWFPIAEGEPFVIDAPYSVFYAPEPVFAAAAARCALLPGLFDFRVNGASHLEMDLVISGVGNLDLLVEIAGTNAVVRHRLFTCDEIMNGDYAKELVPRLEKIGSYTAVS